MPLAYFACASSREAIELLQPLQWDGRRKMAEAFVEARVGAHLEPTLGLLGVHV